MTAQPFELRRISRPGKALTPHRCIRVGADTVVLHVAKPVPTAIWDEDGAVSVVFRGQRRERAPSWMLRMFAGAKR